MEVQKHRLVDGQAARQGRLSRLSGLTQKDVSYRQLVGNRDRIVAAPYSNHGAIRPEVERRQTRVNSTSVFYLAVERSGTLTLALSEEGSGEFVPNKKRRGPN